LSHSIRNPKSAFHNPNIRPFSEHERRSNRYSS
jgi:hypothetical protein